MAFEDIYKPENIEPLDLSGKDKDSILFYSSPPFPVGLPDPSIVGYATNLLYNQTPADLYELDLDADYSYDFFIGKASEASDIVIYDANLQPVVLNSDINDSIPLNKIIDFIPENSGKHIISINWLSENYGSINVEQKIINLDDVGDPIDTNDQDNTISISTIKDMVLDGHSGLDTLRINDSHSGLYLTKLGNSFIVTNGNEILDLSNIERLQFNDAYIAIDLDGSSSAGGIYRTYQAAFDRTPDDSGLGYWIDRADNGASAVEMAEEFVWSNEFQQVYDVNTTDEYLTGNDIEKVVARFYQNVLGREADQGGLEFYTEMIESQEGTVGRALAEIADSQENRENLLPEIKNGIEYDLWLG